MEKCGIMNINQKSIRRYGKMKCKVVSYNSKSVMRYLYIMQKETQLENSNFLTRCFIAPLYTLFHRFECKRLSSIIEQEVKSLC